MRVRLPQTRLHIALLAVLGVALPLGAGDPLRFPGLDPETADPGSTIYYVTGIEAADRFGRSIAVLGDLDGDGVKDFAASGRESLPSFDFPYVGAGRVDVLSGRTGERLLRRFGSDFREFFGHVLGALPDIDGDGVFELGVVNRYGDLFVLSPRSGDTWFSVPRHDEVLVEKEAAFLRVPDRNDDGVEEFVYVEDFAKTRFDNLGCGVSASPTCLRGRVQQHCGRTGELLWRYDEGPPDGSVFGCVGPAGDVDGDGVLDVLVPRRSVDTPGSPLVVISGADGSVLRVHHLRDDVPTFGVGLHSLGDHDGNGFPEIVVSAPQFGFGDEVERGWLGLYHLPDFELIWSVTGRDPRGLPPFGAERGDRLGGSLAVAGDVDGDGFLDLLAGTDRSITTGTIGRHGRLYLHSGKTGEVLTAYEASLDLYLDGPGATTSDVPFFQELSALDDIDGDGFLDFLVGRPTNGPANFGRPREGIVRAVRYRPGGPRFIRGDTTGDGRINLADPIALFGGIFGRREVSCRFAFDANRSATIDILDGLYLLNVVFVPGSASPPPPYPECARYDVLHAFPNLGCEEEGSCRR